MAKQSDFLGDSIFSPCLVFLSMRGDRATDAWKRLKQYTENDEATVYTVKERVPNSISYDDDEDAIALVSQHHAASGDELVMSKSTFETVWGHLRNGEVLSRPDEPEYTDLASLLDGRYRASGILGMLDTVFEEVESDTDPVRVWISE